MRKKLIAILTAVVVAAGLIPAVGLPAYAHESGGPENS